MTTPLFRGVGVALVTLFDDTGDVDLHATASLAARLVDDGMTSVVVAGSTGEAATLEPAERVELVEAVSKAVGGAAPVIAGTGAPSARQAVRLTADAVEAGADGVLVLPPPGSAGVIDYYRQVVSASSGVPVLGYHYPKQSAPGIDVETLPRLTDVGVTGVKDSSGDVSRLLRTLDRFTGSLYVGSAWLLSAAGPLGATGAILAIANIAPALSIAAFRGDVDAQRALTAANERATGPGGVKRLLGEQSGLSTRTRV